MENSSLFEPGVLQASQKDIPRCSVQLSGNGSDDFGDSEGERHVLEGVDRFLTVGPDGRHGR